MIIKFSDCAKNLKNQMRFEALTGYEPSTEMEWHQIDNLYNTAYDPEDCLKTLDDFCDWFREYGVPALSAERMSTIETLLDRLDNAWAYIDTLERKLSKTTGEPYTRDANYQTVEVMRYGKLTTMPYADICTELGFRAKDGIVKITPSGRIDFGGGYPEEAMALRQAVLNSPYSITKKLNSVINW